MVIDNEIFCFFFGKIQYMNHDSILKYFFKKNELHACGYIVKSVKYRIIKFLVMNNTPLRVNFLIFHIKDKYLSMIT